MLILSITNLYRNDVKKLFFIVVIFGSFDVPFQFQIVASLQPFFFFRHKRVDIPLFLAGDFNGCPNGPIYNFFLQNGFKSSYQDFHGREPVVTHLDHNCSPLAVDYIFYRYEEVYKSHCHKP